jgi:hypothetical protein
MSNLLNYTYIDCVLNSKINIFMMNAIIQENLQYKFYKKKFKTI